MEPLPEPTNPESMYVLGEEPTLTDQELQGYLANK